MTTTDQASAEKTYRAIGRFVFEFSQVEYTIRYHLAEEIGLDEEHFSAVVESYDAGLLCTVAIEVFKNSREQNNAARIQELIKNFRNLTDDRNRIAHGLWVPFREGGTVHYVPRRSLKPKVIPPTSTRPSISSKSQRLSAPLSQPSLDWARAH